MKGKVTIPLERFVEEALRGLRFIPQGVEVGALPYVLKDEASTHLRAVVGLVPVDSGAHYRATEAKVLREIRERLPESVRAHFYVLDEKYIEEIAKEMV